MYVCMLIEKENQFHRASSSVSESPFTFHRFFLSVLEHARTSSCMNLIIDFSFPLFFSSVRLRNTFFFTARHGTALFFLCFPFEHHASSSFMWWQQNTVPRMKFFHFLIMCCSQLKYGAQTFSYQRCFILAVDKNSLCKFMRTGSCILCFFKCIFFVKDKNTFMYTFSAYMAQEQFCCRSRFAYFF